jgi:hypothetical protein
MQKKLSLLKDAYFCFFAILFVSLAIVGGFKNYSSIPFWDMWNGYLNFYTKVSAGDLSAWWAQHNEHRIVLARIFFWLDIRYFHGQGWLLIIVNYLLLSFATAVMVMAGKKLLDQREDRYLLWFLVAWMFFWSQHENLTWGFQSQFFLAFLLPLVSILLLWQSHQSSKSDKVYFTLSLLTGVACIGSMANGALAIPLLFVYSLFLKVSWRRSLLLFIFSVLCLFLYFYGYQSPSGHGSLVATIKTDFFGLFRYTARYLGSPFASVIGDKSFRPVVEVLGFFVIFFTVYQLVNNFIKGKVDSLNCALLTFVVYVIVTAFVTAGGRLIFGLDQALSGRYTTPAIMVWSVVLLILAQLANNRKNLITIGLATLIVCMLPFQIKAIQNKTSDLTERSVAALSLALNLQDEDQIKSILPSAKWGLELSKVPREKGYSIFGYGDIADFVNFLNKNAIDLSMKKSKLCHGYIDSSVDREDSSYILLEGWLNHKQEEFGSHPIYFYNNLGYPIGGGFLGLSRPDVSESLRIKNQFMGFKAYIKSDKKHDSFFVRIGSYECQLYLDKNNGIIYGR